jgi:hypothetical protein
VGFEQRGGGRGRARDARTGQCRRSGGRARGPVASVGVPAVNGVPLVRARRARSLIRSGSPSSAAARSSSAPSCSTARSRATSTTERPARWAGFPLLLLAHTDFIGVPTGGRQRCHTLGLHRAGPGVNRPRSWRVLISHSRGLRVIHPVCLGSALSGQGAGVGSPRAYPLPATFLTSWLPTCTGGVDTAAVLEGRFPDDAGTGPKILVDPRPWADPRPGRGCGETLTSPHRIAVMSRQSLVRV